MDQEESFIEHLFVTYHEALKYYCMRCFSYQSHFLPYVDDCIQEVFFAALKKKDKLFVHPNPYAWLRNACKKQCLMVLRRNKIWQKVIGKYETTEVPAPTTCIEDDILRWLCLYDTEKWVKNLKERLSDSERLVFIEYFENEKSAVDIAKIHHTSVSSIRGAIQRIRKKALHIELLIMVLGQFSLFLLCSI